MKQKIAHKKLNQPTARTKYLLIIGFTACLAVSVILAVVGLSFTHNNLSRINEIVETNNVKTSLLREMHSAARERSLLLHMMLNLDDPFERDALFLEFNKHGGRFATARNKLLSMPLSDTEKDLLARQGEVSSIAVPVQRNIVDLIQQEQMRRAKDLLLNQAVPLQNQVLELLSGLQDYQEKASQQTASQGAHDLDSLIWQTFIFVVLGALIGIILGIVANRLDAGLVEIAERIIDEISMKSLLRY